MYYFRTADVNINILATMTNRRKMIIFMLSFILLYSCFLPVVQPLTLRKFGVFIPSKSGNLVDKFLFFIEQQQMKMEAEKAEEIEGKRHKIYNDYLVSRIKGSILSDFDGRFY